MVYLALWPSVSWSTTSQVTVSKAPLLAGFCYVEIRARLCKGIGTVVLRGEHDYTD